MILDSIQNSASIEAAHPLFKQAFDYFKANDLKNAPAGKTQLKGEDLIVIVSEIEGKKQTEAVVETHRKYIDIQIPVIGTETMGWIAAESLIKPMDTYNEAKDLILYEDISTTFIDVTNGNFAIFFPEDGHAPGIGNGYIKKVIFKVAL